MRIPSSYLPAQPRPSAAATAPEGRREGPATQHAGMPAPAEGSRTDMHGDWTAAPPDLNMPWVDSPFFESMLERSGYPSELKEQIRFFSREGYLVMDVGVPGFDALAESIKSDLVIGNRVQDAWKSHAGVKALATAPRVLEMLEILYRRRPIPFQTLNFAKGTEQATHSDTIHFHCVPEKFMCGVWVALEDIDAYNGPLHYYPGSHNLPIYDLNALGLCGSMQREEYEHYGKYQDFIAALIAHRGLRKAELNVRKGQALIWAANLLHGGSPILDKSRSRHSQVTHYYFEDCLYYTPMNSDPFLQRTMFRSITDIGTGRIVPNRYNGITVGSWPVFQFPAGNGASPRGQAAYR